MARVKTGELQLRAVRRAVRDLERSVEHLLRTAVASGAGAAPRRALKLSPKRRAALRLHGRYLGHIRLLKPAQKAKVKATRAAKGYDAAIGLAKRMAGQR